jgi:hypothetical protein
VSTPWDEVFPEPAPVPGRIVARRRIGFVVLGTVAALVVGGMTWLLTYDPLAWVDGSYGGPQSTLAWSTVDNGVDYPVYYVSSGETGAFNVGFEVTNTGRLPVTVTGLAEPTAFRLAQMGRYSGNNVPGGGHFAGGLVAFEPVSIAPGDSRYLVLELRVTEEMVCKTPGGAAIYSHPEFRFRALGFIPRSSTVETPFRVVSTCGDAVPPEYHPRS